MPGPARFVPPDKVARAVVKQLPPARRPSSQVYPHRYAEALAAIRKVNGPGVTTKVAEYTSPRGASNAALALRRGQYVCDGRPGDWEFESRRTDDGSVLYATLKAKPVAKSKPRPTKAK